MVGLLTVSGFREGGGQKGEQLLLRIGNVVRRGGAEGMIHFSAVEPDGQPAHSGGRENVNFGRVAHVEDLPAGTSGTVFRQAEDFGLGLVAAHLAGDDDHVRGKEGLDAQGADLAPLLPGGAVGEKADFVSPGGAEAQD